MTVIERYAAFASEMQPPELAVHAAKRCILDWYGAALAGSVEAPATLLRQAFPGDGDAGLLPDGEGRDARTAALINGAASHIVEVDDIYRSGLYHPGVVTIPPALALGEVQGVTGATLIRAVIAGYEISNRIAQAVNPAHYQHWHTTGTVGHFGAAVSSGVVLGLTQGQMAHAMATVATFAAGLRHAFSADGMSKPLHAGRAAEAGVTAALMARAGVTGVGDMLEGERGFGQSMSKDVDWDQALETLGSEWTVTQTTAKAHACCGHNFAALDAIRLLMSQHDLQADQITRIKVHSYRAALEICGNSDPVSAAEARFSLPWCSAIMALQGAVTPAAFTTEALQNTTTRTLADKVELILDAKAEARFPHARSATVELHLSDGRIVQHHRPTRKGDPDDPMTDADLTAKFHALADPVLGEASAHRLASDLLNLDQIDNIRELRVGQP